MPSRLDAIVEAIAADLRTIPGLKNVITYWPDQPGPLPMIYLDVERMDMPDDGWAPFGAMTIDWGINAYLVTAPITAKASAAATLARELLPQIAEVIGHDLDARGALSGATNDRDGILKLTAMSPPGTVQIGGHTYRARRLTFQAIEMFTYQYSE